ncbi:MAG: RNA-binding S4 domain-containing protein [Eubacteriaceae bacterium]
MEIIEIKTEFIKIDQLLKFAGVVGTGSDAKMMIADEMVHVNGELCTQRNKKIRKGDIINIEDYGTLEVKGLGE